jgi:hypothetical protein
MPIRPPRMWQRYLGMNSGLSGERPAPITRRSTITYPPYADLQFVSTRTQRFFIPADYQNLNTRLSPKMTAKQIFSHIPLQQELPIILPENDTKFESDIIPFPVQGRSLRPSAPVPHNNSVIGTRHLRFWTRQHSISFPVIGGLLCVQWVMSTAAPNWLLKYFNLNRLLIKINQC